MSLTANIYKKIIVNPVIFNRKNVDLCFEKIIVTTNKNISCNNFLICCASPNRISATASTPPLTVTPDIFNASFYFFSMIRRLGNKIISDEAIASLGVLSPSGKSTNNTAIIKFKGFLEYLCLHYFIISGSRYVGIILDCYRRQPVRKSIFNQNKNTLNSLTIKPYYYKHLDNS